MIVPIKEVWFENEEDLCERLLSLEFLEQLTYPERQESRRPLCPRKDLECERSKGAITWEKIIYHEDPMKRMARMTPDCVLDHLSTLYTKKQMKEAAQQIKELQNQLLFEGTAQYRSQQRRRDKLAKRKAALTQ